MAITPAVVPFDVFQRFPRFSAVAPVQRDASPFTDYYVRLVGEGIEAPSYSLTPVFCLASPRHVHNVCPR